MKRRARREVEIFNLSFLDVVSCGFGTIILLLVLVKISEPRVLAEQSADLRGLVQSLEDRRQAVATEQAALDPVLASRQAELEDVRQALARARETLDALRRKRSELRSERQAQDIVRDRLESAKQDLSEEMRRLLGADYLRPKSDATIGGIPVDSEYVIFIIDTSGSMQEHAWPLVRKKVEEVLEIYPAVKGIQVMNDMGDYMFSQYAGRWIPDTPARRGAIVKRLGDWAPFSNSSPVEGIEAAIRRFHAQDKRISLYVFGDDFARGSIQSVVDTVDKLNRADARGERRVRIHTVGFPVLFETGGTPPSLVRFAALMRRLAEDNGGSFVGLNGLRP